MFHLELGSTPRCIPQRPTTCRLPPVQNRTAREAARPLTLAFETDTYVPQTLSSPAAHRRSVAQIGSTSRTLPLWEGEHPFVRSSMLPSCSGWAFFLLKGTGRNQFPGHGQSRRSVGHLCTSPCFRRLRCLGLAGGRHANHRLLNPNRAQRPKQPREHTKGQEKEPRIHSTSQRIPRMHTATARAVALCIQKVPWAFRPGPRSHITRPWRVVFAITEHGV